MASLNVWPPILSRLTAILAQAMASAKPGRKHWFHPSMRAALDDRAAAGIQSPVVRYSAASCEASWYTSGAWDRER